MINLENFNLKVQITQMTLITKLKSLNNTLLWDLDHKNETMKKI
jgi:hypothetical protein